MGYWNGQCDECGAKSEIVSGKDCLCRKCKAEIEARDKQELKGRGV